MKRLVITFTFLIFAISYLLYLVIYVIRKPFEIALSENPKKSLERSIVRVKRYMRA